MKIWSLVSQKGGSTKSTNTIDLAVAAVGEGEKVLIIDADEQKTCVKWWTKRDGDEDKPYVVECDDVAHIDNIIQSARKKGFTYVFIDTPGSLGVEFQKAASVSTMCIVPAAPSIVDLHPSVTTAHYLKNEDRKFVFLLSKVPAVGRDGHDARAALEQFGLVCKHWTTDRKAQKRAYASGLGVIEYAQMDKTAQTAADEIKNIFNWIKAKESKLNSSFGDSAVDNNIEELETAL